MSPDRDLRRGATGATGATGAAGAAAPSRRGPQLVLFVFVVCAFVYLAYLVQGNIEAIEDERHTNDYQSCIGGLEILTAYNEQLLKLADVDRRALNATDPAPTEFQRALFTDRIAVYEAGVIPLPDCRKLLP